MSDYAVFNPAIQLLRHKGLPPTYAHISVAKLLLEKPNPASVEDLLEQAMDQDMGLSRESLHSSLNNFSEVGLVRWAADSLQLQPQTQEENPSLENVEAISNVLKAIANPWRFKILCLLSSKEMCVGDLEAQLDLTQSALSQHLSRLREAGLVKIRQCRQNRFYRLSSPQLPQMMEQFCSACQGLKSCSKSLRDVAA